MKKILSLALALIMLIGCTASFASCSQDDGETTKGMSDSLLPAKALTTTVTVPSDFKIGFIFLHDENSTYDANFINAAKEIKTLFNLSDDQVIMKTQISESNDCYEAAKELAEAGCKIVFADSFGHEAFLSQAAAEYPDVQFCHATGTTAHTEAAPSNLHNAFAAIYEGRYLAGIVAGEKLNQMIEAGTITADKAVIGYVGAFTYAEVISGLSSFYLGAKSVCPSVTMKVQFTGSWYDESLEQEAANALISQGCVLISQHADSMGAPSACETANVPNVSYNGSTYDACPDTFLISSAINWAPYFQYIIESVVNGTEIADDWCGGIDEGSVVLSGINNNAAPEGTAEAVQAAIDGFKAGTLHVFDTTKDNYITVGGEKLTSVVIEDKEVVYDGYFHESDVSVRSAPYFEVRIDGITFLNEKY
jgi:basic membrane protein A